MIAPNAASLYQQAFASSRCCRAGNGHAHRLFKAVGSIESLNARTLALTYRLKGTRHSGEDSFLTLIKVGACLVASVSWRRRLVRAASI